MSEFSYPFGAKSSAPWRRGALERLRLAAKKAVDPWRAPDRNRSTLKLRSGAGRPLAQDEAVVLFLTRNDRRFMPSFLEHYRKMGVTRFVCVDDRSVDGTVDYLAGQSDTDLFTSTLRYREADRGKVWREELLARYGKNRWYIIVDSDEYLLYETLGQETVTEFAKRLSERGVARLPAPMLDLYPVGDLNAALFTGQIDQRPWDVATHFDADGYRAIASGAAISIYGGVRARAFGANGELMKYPLMRWDRFCSLGRTIHRPRPASYNFAPAMGALLHFKVFSDFEDRVKDAISEGQHYKGARSYQKMLDHFTGKGIGDLRYSGSKRYEGPTDLLKSGFMLAL